MKQPGRAQQIINVLWLSFVTAGIATGIFFSAIDPAALRPCVVFPEVSRMGAYSIGFLLFWLLTAATGLLVIYFQREVFPSQSQ
jgi:hypothetical protein